MMKTLHFRDDKILVFVSHCQKYLLVILIVDYVAKLIIEKIASFLIMIMIGTNKVVMTHSRLFIGANLSKLVYSPKCIGIQIDI